MLTFIAYEARWPAWNQPDKETAKDFLTDWVYRAGSSMIPMLVKLAHKIATHFHGILAYYDYPISTGPLEGTNNKIKIMKRQAHGFRDDRCVLRQTGKAAFCGRIHLLARPHHFVGPG